MSDTDEAPEISPAAKKAFVPEPPMEDDDDGTN